MNKRGVSPLLATVLLIAFAIALGAVVLNYGENFVLETSAEPLLGTECPQGCEPLELAPAETSIPEPDFNKNIVT